MKLYYSPAACSLAPHIALYEAGLNFSAERVDLKTKQTETGKDFKKINAKGSVPALELPSGELLTESAVILQYIADQSQSVKLSPPSAGPQHYKFIEWLNYVATEMHKGIGVLWSDQLDEKAKDFFRGNLPKKFDLLNEHFSKNEYLMGSQYTVADAYLFTVLNWTNFLKIDLSAWKNVVSLCDRVRARPAVQTALKAEGLLKAA